MGPNWFCTSLKAVLPTTEQFLLLESERTTKKQLCVELGKNLILHCYIDFGGFLSTDRSTFQRKTVR